MVEIKENEWDVLDDYDHNDELNNNKMIRIRCKEIFKVVQSKYFSYVHCYTMRK